MLTLEAIMLVLIGMPTIEIVALILLALQVAEMAREQGRGPLSHVVFFVLLWLTGKGLAVGAGVWLTDPSHWELKEYFVIIYAYGCLGGAVGAGIAYVFTAGHRTLSSLIRREFSAYFFSPIAYVVLAVFLAVTGHLFYLTLEQLTETGPRGIVNPMEIMVGNVAFWLVYLFIPPLLTMRLFAEEKSSGTLEMLMTAPVRDWQVVVAKYIACFGFYALMWLPTLLYLPILADWHPQLVAVDRSSVPLMATYVTSASIAVFFVFLGLCLMILAFNEGRLSAGLFMFVLAALLAAGVGLAVYPIYAQGKWWIIECGIDPWPIATTYLGLALAGAMFLSIGLFVSSLVNSQMIAALVALFLGLLFIAGYWLPEMDTNGLRYQITYFFSVPLHFERNFSRGLVDTRQVVLYSSVTLFGLFMTIRSLESRRWR